MNEVSKEFEFLQGQIKRAAYLLMQDQLVEVGWILGSLSSICTLNEEKFREGWEDKKKKED